MKREDLWWVQAMPLLGGRLDTGRTESEDLTEAVALSLEGLGSSPPPAPPQQGISFAHMAKMGFAASGTLKPCPPCLCPSICSLAP